MRLISAIVLSYNEETNLPDCLASLRGVADEVFVVDSGSTDATIAIAERHGARIFSHPFENYAAQRNWAIDNLPLEGEWVLHLDADERLTRDLGLEMLRMLPVAAAELDGFRLRKRSIFMGRWIRHGGHYPSFHLRVIRRGKGRCEERLYDQHFVVKGRSAALENDYIDVISSDPDVWTLRHLRWASLEAAEVESASSPVSRVRADWAGNPIERRRWLREKAYLRGPLFFRAFAYFLYRYVLRLGFLDGREGLIFHFLQGCWFRFFVDLKIDSMRRTRQSAGRLPTE
jgi:glycosyltransferase involved in cell wall biosynthesis